jgi:hypothetical protein
MGGPGWATQAEFASTTSYDLANYSNSVRQSILPLCIKVLSFNTTTFWDCSGNVKQKAGIMCVLPSITSFFAEPSYS